MKKIIFAKSIIFTTFGKFKKKRELYENVQAI